MVVGSACTASGAKNAIKPDPGIQFLTPAQGDTVLRQCSRAAPVKGDRYFRPRARDVADFEQALQKTLDSDPVFQGELGWRKEQGHPLEVSLKRGWGRDIIGIERGGTRSIYGNYYPVETIGDHPPSGPMIICDGGPQFFGAEFDMAQGKIVHLAFNGSI